jgi:hypothetical protein
VAFRQGKGQLFGDEANQALWSGERQKLPLVQEVRRHLPTTLSKQPSLPSLTSDRRSDWIASVHLGYGRGSVVQHHVQRTFGRLLFSSLAFMDERSGLECRREKQSWHVGGATFSLLQQAPLLLSPFGFNLT